MSKSSPVIKHVDNLTGVRAYAALWVVFFHIDLGGFSGRRFGHLAYRGFMGVDIFFVLSGFVLSLVYGSGLPTAFQWSWYRKFLSRRFAKIYPLHLLTFSGVVVLFLVERRLGHHIFPSVEKTLRSAIAQILLLNAFGVTHGGAWNYVSWSVSAEWFAYTIVFAPTVFLLRRVPTGFVMAGALLLWFAFLLLSMHVANPGDLFTNMGIARIFPEFLCGYALYRLLHGAEQSSDRKISGDMQMLVGLFFLAVVVFGRDTFIFMLVPTVMLLLAGLFRGGPLSDLLFGNQVVVRLGEASYSIYLTQIFVFFAGANLVSAFHLHPSRWMIVVVALVQLVGAALLGLITFHYFEEPTRQRLVAFFSARRGAGDARMVTR